MSALRSAIGADRGRTRALPARAGPPACGRAAATQALGAGAGAAASDGACLSGGAARADETFKSKPGAARLRLSPCCRRAAPLRLAAGLSGRMQPLALARARPHGAPLRPAAARSVRRSKAPRPRACAAAEPPAEPAAKSAAVVKSSPLFGSDGAFSDDFDGALTSAYISAAQQREEAYRRRWAELSAAAPETLRPAPSPPAPPTAVQPPAAGKPTASPAVFRTQNTPPPPQQPPAAPGGPPGGEYAAAAPRPAAPAPSRSAGSSLPARASVSALWAVLFLLPVTTLLASLAAAAASQARGARARALAACALSPAPFKC